MTFWTGFVSLNCFTDILPYILKYDFSVASTPSNILNVSYYDIKKRIYISYNNKCQSQNHDGPILDQD